MFYFKKFTLFIFSSFLLTHLIQAQTQISTPIPAASSVNVNQLTNSQVNKAKTAFENSGMSPQAAIEVARQKGATEQQINDMMKRMSQVDASNSYESSTTDENNDDKLDKNRELIDADLSANDEDNQYSNRASRMADDKEQSFGDYLFNSKNLTFEPNINIQTPKNYTIGIGDQLIINVWGNSQNNYLVKVNQNGQVVIPDVGPIYVAGTAFELASDKIIDRLSSIYADLKSASPNTFAQVNMAQLRAIQVNVVGEVVTPGSYTLPVTATLFNALYLSGGPAKNGSFRNIQIIRNGKVFKTIDIYKFLVDANLSDNIPLQNDDVISVPVFTTKIQTVGEFKRNMLFEMKEKETLSDLLRYSGGLSQISSTSNFQIKRRGQESSEILDIPLQDISKTVLRNGDIIRTYKMGDLFRNRITIMGSVFRPGEYEWNEGMTMSQLIAKADSLMPDAFLKRGIITRVNSDQTTTTIAFTVGDVINGKSDLLLRPEDKVHIKSHFNLKQKQYIVVGGEVIKPGSFSYSDSTSIADAIFMAGGLKEGADSTYVEVARRPSYKESAVLSDTMQHVFTFQINRDLSISDNDKNFYLAPFDIVSVRHAPGYRNPGVVVILGEVKYAGPFALVTRADRISDILQKAGGITKYAQVSGATLTRFSAELGHELVAINLEKILEKPGSASDLLIRHGDSLNIPKKMQTVKISGNVLNAISTTYVPGKRAKFYIEQSGGYGENTRKSKVYVRYPNGTAAITKRNLFVNIYPKVLPGCEIIVPVKPIKENRTGEWIGVASALSTLTIAIVTIVNMTSSN